MELARLQSLLYRLITAPSGVEEGLSAEKALGVEGLEAIIRGDERLSASERVGIYADAYFYRLLEVFKEDYPATLAVLGDTNFHNLITGYLIEYPPTEPSIAHASRYLPDFMRGHPLPENFPFIADLATLERALVEIFHAADATPLTATNLSIIPPEQWPTLVMRRHPASRVSQLGWRVEHIQRAVERQESWHAPAAAVVHILISRRDGKVFYRELQAGECPALQLMEKGASFAAICEAVAGDTGERDAAARISGLLGRWLSEEILILERPSPSPAA
jgi:hypothetical protein